MFQSLRLRLLVSYLIVIAAILGASGTAAYVFFDRSLEHQLNQHLLTLAQAATPSIENVEKEGLQNLNQELAWRELFKRNQSLEWFDADGKLIAREGNTFLTLPLKKAFKLYNNETGFAP